MSRDELDQLLHDYFNLTRNDLIAALKTVPTLQSRTGTLTADEARLLDNASLVENPHAYAEVATELIIDLAHLINTAYTSAEVASGLGISSSLTRRRRRARTLWVIRAGSRWVYPVSQFEILKAVDGSPLLKQLRGLDQVLPALPENLHPAAVAGFLLTPQPELLIGGSPTTVRGWLLAGGAVQQVLELIDVAEWAAR